MLNTVKGEEEETAVKKKEALYKGEKKKVLRNVSEKSKNLEVQS